MTTDAAIGSAEVSSEVEPVAEKKGSWTLVVIAAAVILGTTFTMLSVPLKPEAIGILAFLQMLTLIFLKLPVALAMMIPSLLGLYALRGWTLVESTLATVPYSTTATWSLSVIPMFVLMGLLMWKAGVTGALYGAARNWLGWMPGGLAVGTNLAGTGLAAVSGSTVGTTYALARIGIPEMLKAGYSKRMAIGSVMVAGLPGQLIPPSILLVIFAGIAEVPVGPQLMAGIGPGLFVSLVFSVMLVVYAITRPQMAGRTIDRAIKSVTWGERCRSLLPVWPVPVIILVIVWGIFSGVFTATEAGAASAVVALAVTFVYRRSQGAWRAVADAAVAAVSSVGAIFLLLVGVDVLSRMMVLTGITDAITDLVAFLDLGPIGFLLLMLVVYLILGMFLDPLPMLMLTVPVLIPTLEMLDISLIWFGVFAVFMGELAVITPPVGILSFIIYGIVRDPEVNGGQHMTLGDVFMAALFFLPVAVAIAIVLIFVPEIATYLPDMLSSSG